MNGEGENGTIKSAAALKDLISRTVIAYKTIIYHMRPPLPPRQLRLEKMIRCTHLVLPRLTN
jgi:hypothetical protein